jgi:hypothetical protein
LKIDTDKKGLEAIFPPYQIDALRVVFGTKGGATSREIWNAVKARGHDVSRASIINFGADMVKEGVFEDRQITGKGGYRSVYYAKMTPAGLVENILVSVSRVLADAFADKEWWMK